MSKSDLVRCRDCGARVARGDAFVAFETEYRCADCNEEAWERHYDRMDDPPAAPTNDIAEWGERDISGAYDGPLSIPGLGSVDVNELPPLTDQDREAQDRARRSGE